MLQTHTDFDQAETENSQRAANEIKRLESISNRQREAIKDIHSLVFLNLDIPAAEREKILSVIATVIRL